MGLEIERKFLVDRTLWRADTSGVVYRQDHLCSQKERIVRVRAAGRQAFLTIKGETQNINRLEFEYPLPSDDAAILLG